MTDDAIYALLTLKRVHHPELRRDRLSWPGLQRICARERVELLVRPHAEPAQLVGLAGQWAILVDAQQPLRRHTYYAAHELAHYWLHVEAAGSGSSAWAPIAGSEAFLLRASGHLRPPDQPSAVYNFTGYGGPDPREDDAELLATLMLQGPRFSRPS